VLISLTAIAIGPSMEGGRRCGAPSKIPAGALEWRRTGTPSEKRSSSRPLAVDDRLIAVVQADDGVVISAKVRCSRSGGYRVPAARCDLLDAQSAQDPAVATLLDNHRVFAMPRTTRRRSRVRRRRPAGRIRANCRPSETGASRRRSDSLVLSSTEKRDHRPVPSARFGGSRARSLRP
jgi:hypothetical protein